ncbi:MAG: flavodoxin family protein [Candidatus Bipolaricaulota bacterium]|nr:flavodoxin family protein [Candidatus Bipolaricaulota bacterium]
MTRIVGIAASPRHGNTEILVKEALRAAQELSETIAVELVTFAGKRIEPCTDCGACVRNKTYCWKQDDWWELIKPLVEPVPAGVIIGTPVYFFSTPSLLRAYFERCTCLFKQLWHADFPFSPPDWTRTAAGTVAVGFHRHGGVEHALSSVHHVLLTNGFVCVGGDYIGGGAWQLEEDSLDAVLKDRIGIAAARLVGERVGTTALLLQGGRPSAKG